MILCLLYILSAPRRIKMLKTKNVYECDNVFVAIWLKECHKINPSYVYVKGNTPNDVVYIYEYSYELDNYVNEYYKCFVDSES